MPLRVVKTFYVHQMEMQRWKRKFTVDRDKFCRDNVFSDSSSFAYSRLCKITLLYSFPKCSLPLQQSVPHYKQQLDRDILTKKRCPRGEVKSMYNISETWKILLLILIPAKYLKDVLYLSNRATIRGQILQRNPNLFRIHRLSWLSQPFEHPSLCLFDTAPLKTHTGGMNE